MAAPAQQLLLLARLRRLLVCCPRLPQAAATSLAPAPRDASVAIFASAFRRRSCENSHGSCPLWASRAGGAAALQEIHRRDGKDSWQDALLAAVALAGLGAATWQRRVAHAEEEVEEATTEAVVGGQATKVKERAEVKKVPALLLDELKVRRAEKIAATSGYFRGGSCGWPHSMGELEHKLL